ncbi:hypothetical protein JNW98_24095 [Streptomyces sp. SCA2-4]|nr:hypothetical protein [Streptomyces huiliensis]
MPGRGTPDPGPPVHEAPPPEPAGRVLTASVPEEADGPPPCRTCGGGAPPGPDDGDRPYRNHPYGTPSYVYALGRVEPQFPSLGVEKEFAQAVGRAEAVDLTDRQTLQAVVADPRNRYLARRLCYVLTVQGLETYLVRPRDPVDFSLLVEALGESRPTDLHGLVGLRGPLAAPGRCGGLALPVVTFDQIFTFDTASLVRALPRPEALEETRFRSAAEELFERVMHLTDNAGASDAHRALNYLVVRYPSVYARTAEAYAGGSSLTAIDTRPSRLSGTRNILDVVFSYTGRTTDVTEKYFVRVDVTEEFPFLVTKLSPYYDR